MQIAIIDYGMGNLASVRNALAHLGVSAVLTDDAAVVAQADALILPGVGAFGQAMANLRARHLVDVLTRQVMERRIPFLGICLGMQLLASSSGEHGEHRGLDWVPGRVEKLDVAGLRLPHIGWNDLTVRVTDPLFQGLSGDRNFYFVHTYALRCAESCVLATCEYGTPFVAAIRQDNILATQFHPEKSHHNGLLVLKNFVVWAQAQTQTGGDRACSNIG